MVYESYSMTHFSKLRRKKVFQNFSKTHFFRRDLVCIKYGSTYFGFWVTKFTAGMSLRNSVSFFSSKI